MHTLKAVGSVVLGYLVLAILLAVALTAAYLAMGADRAFRPASYEVSPLWLLVWFIISLAAAVVGGVVCRVTSRSPRAVISLGIVVLALGVLSALAPRPENTEPRSAEVSSVDAMMMAEQPPAVLWSTPVIGMAGVLLGGLLLGPLLGPRGTQAQHAGSTH